jgi:chloramphenicol 3-O-phosphotransferase
MSGKRSSFVSAKTALQASNKKATAVAVIKRRAKIVLLNKGSSSDKSSNLDSVLLKWI